jgi:hypothetical protein
LYQIVRVDTVCCRTDSSVVRRLGTVLNLCSNPIDAVVGWAYSPALARSPRLADISPKGVESPAPSLPLELVRLGYSVNATLFPSRPAPFFRGA